MAGFAIVMLMMFVLGVLFWGCVYLLYSYILEGIFLKHACTNLQIRARWRAWIPFCSQYMLGKTVGKGWMGALVALLHMVAIALLIWFLRDPGPIGGYGMLLAVVAGVVVKMFIASNIFKTWAGERGKLFTVLSAVSLGTLRPIFLFLIRKKVCMFSKST